MTNLHEAQVFTPSELYFSLVHWLVVRFIHHDENCDGYWNNGNA